MLRITGTRHKVTSQLLILTSAIRPLTSALFFKVAPISRQLVSRHLTALQNRDSI
jgi:hypothetical protein